MRRGNYKYRGGLWLGAFLVLTAGLWVAKWMLIFGMVIGEMLFKH